MNGPEASAEPKSLLQQLSAALDRTSPVCPFPAILAAIEPRERELLIEALKPKRLGSDRLAKMLRSAGHTASEGRVEAHKNGSCGCPSPTT